MEAGDQLKEKQAAVVVIWNGVHRLRISERKNRVSPEEIQALHGCSSVRNRVVYPFMFLSDPDQRIRDPNYRSGSGRQVPDPGGKFRIQEANSGSGSATLL